MPREKGQIGLSVAVRTKPTKDSFDYRTASVERWVEGLPVGNIGETTRLVYEALKQVNRLSISWKERYRFLELLREPVNYAQTALVRRYTGQAFPLPEKTQRIAILARTLYSEMALGYKTAIEEMLDSSFLSRDNKALTIMIHRAVRYLSQAMLTSYQTYSPHPEDSWFELHVLYLYAEHKKVYQDKVRDEHNSLMPESSIARAYKQILLLALASPYRLRQGEAEAVYSALARWAGHAHIIPYNDPSASDALFVVHMDSDEAPDYQAFNHRDCNTELCRLVDTRQLSHVLIEDLEQRRTGPLPHELLHRMIRAWGVAPKRNFARSDRASTIEVVVGVTMLHQALARELGIPELHQKRASFNSKTVVGVSQPTREDVWDIFGSQKMKKNYERYKAMTEQAEVEDEPLPDLISQHWQVRNESAGGYRLALEQAQNAKVQVGELIGLRHATNSAAWEIAVIRWLRQGDDGSLEIGAQVLAPQARPSMVSNDKARGSASGYQYALLLPEIATIKQHASIITPAMLFHPGDALNMHLPGIDIKLKLGNKLMDSGSFAQFLYTSAQQPETPRPSPDADSMDTVWDEL